MKGVLAVTLTLDQLTHLRELEAAAIPGPWKQGSSTHRAVAANDYHVADFHHGHEQVFVCALRNAAPALLEAAGLGIALSADDVEKVLTDVGFTREALDKSYSDLMSKIDTLTRVQLERDAAIAEATALQAELRVLRVKLSKLAGT